MRRNISSVWTIVFKLVVPLALISLNVILVLAYVQLPSPDAFIGTILAFVPTAFFCWWGVNLKRVSVDDQNLYASNWIKEIAIPLSEIDAVDAWPGGWRVIVRLRVRTAFGRKINFLAAWRPLLFGSHPIVEELRQLLIKRGNS